jgi:hypothetical protein
MVLIVAGIFGGLFYFLHDACDQTVSRFPSPNSTYDAVLTRTNCGATTAFMYSVYVVKHNDADLGDPVFISSHGDGPSLSWISETDLIVANHDENIERYTNYVEFLDPKGPPIRISIFLQN